MIYRFDDIEVDTDRFELRRGGAPRKVEPQVFALVELLVSCHDRLVSKDELNLRVWGGRVVSDAVVNSRIRSARQAIGDDGRTQRLIRTVHGRGFRFVGTPVIESDIACRSMVEQNRLPDMAAGEPNGTLAAAGRPSIAVLPFRMLSADERYAMVADAVAHEVIVELSRLHWLFVIARGSSFHFRGPDVDLHAASTVLGVRYLLTGTVTVEERRSIVTVELIQGSDSRVVWADRFEGSIDDLMTLRLTIATKVVIALELRIPAIEAGRAASLPSERLDSWSAYHRGLWHMYRFNAHDNEIAAAMFDRAIAADAGFARAYAGLSFTHFQNAFVGYSKDAGDDRRKAQALAEKGLELDPLDPFVNLTMGRAVMLSGDLDSSLSWFERCVEFSPNYAFAIYNRALADVVVGHGDASERGAVRAMSLSPVDPLRYAMLATRALSHLVRGDFATAREWADQAARAPNAHIHIRVIAALTNELAGDGVAAERWATDVRRIDPTYGKARFLAAFPFRDDRTRAFVQQSLERLGI